MRPLFARDIEFHKLLARRAYVDLSRLMLEFAADAYPKLDELACLEEIGRLGRQANDRVQQLRGTTADLRSKLSAVSQLLYRDEHFCGNDEEYYDPRNSYLNEVLDRKCGIPISLGILYLAVASLAKLPMYGVGTPGHFVLGCTLDGETLYVDPFSRGAVMSQTACVDLIEGVLGQQGVIYAEHFRPATPREIAARVLRNLKAAHAMENNWDAALPVQTRLAMLLPHKPDERRDLGLIYLRTGQPEPALAILEKYLETCRADEAEALAPYVDSARRQASE